MTRPTLLLDLDGTLVHSVPDIAAALNRLMLVRGLAAFSDAETALMVGDGVAMLIERAFAARGRHADAAAIPEYSADYVAHAADATQTFPGVPETLHALSNEGWRLAVCTNKPEAAARTLLQQNFVGPPKVSLKALLATAPLDGIDLERDRSPGRDVDL